MSVHTQPVWHLKFVAVQTQNTGEVDTEIKQKLNDFYALPFHTDQSPYLEN